ncbi:MAG: hypothetical protein WCC90_06590 [Methylocella sp.]
MLDWQPIKKDFLSGRYTMEQLAQRYGCSVVAIRKTRSREQWPLPKTKVIARRRATRILEGPTDEQVDHAVKTQVAVIREHQRLIGDTRERVHALVGDLETAKGSDGVSELAILAAKANIVANLACALKTLVGLERQAFMISDEKQDDWENMEDRDLLAIVGKHLPKYEAQIKAVTTSAEN